MKGADLPALNSSPAELSFVHFLLPSHFFLDQTHFADQGGAWGSWMQLQYPSLPWVRYITQSGDIAVRLPDVQ